jgi:hypothetical protein
MRRRREPRLRPDPEVLKLVDTLIVKVAGYHWLESWVIKSAGAVSWRSVFLRIAPRSIKY